MMSGLLFLKIINSRLRCLFLIYLWCVSTFSSADKLELVKGDVVNGRFVSATFENIIFESDSFGQITIAADRVKKLTLTDGIQVENVGRCSLEKFSPETVWILCGFDIYSVPHAFLSPSIRMEALEDISPPWRSSGNISIAGEKERGNANGDEWEVEFHYSLQKEVHRNRFDFEYENDISDEGANEEEYYVAYNYDWFFTNSWFLNSNISWEKDDTDNIAEELHYGVGAGYQFWKTKVHSLGVEFGYAYITQEFTDESPKWGASKEYNALTWSTDWWIMFVDQIKLFHNHQLTQSLREPSDYQLDTETGFRFFVTKALYAQIKYEWDIKGEPSEGNVKTDETWTLGLGVKW